MTTGAPGSRGTGQLAIATASSEEADRGRAHSAIPTYCAWCGNWISGPRDGAPVSHGMCSTCEAQWDEEG